MKADLLAAQAPILAQCQATLGDDVATYGTMVEMQAVEERSQRTPALYVIYDGLRPTRATAGGRVQELTLRWLVVVAVRNVANTEGTQAQEEAGALLARLIPALQAFRPDADHTPLTLADTPDPVYREGFAYIPTAWETTTHSQTTNRSTT